MEIRVIGKGEQYFTPNEVKLQITFFKKEATYEKALEKGTFVVLDFMNQLLLKVTDLHLY